MPWFKTTAAESPSTRKENRSYDGNRWDGDYHINIVISSKD